MSLEKHEVFKCDRCGAIERPRLDRDAEDDDGFPRRWARVSFIDSRVTKKLDLCVACANDVGCSIRNGQLW